MAIERQTVIYDGPGGPFAGVAVVDGDWTEPRPGVLIVPNVLGEKEQDRVTAERIAALGYAALVADLYGKGKRTTRESPDPAVYMNSLNADRPNLNTTTDHLFYRISEIITQKIVKIIEAKTYI